MRKLEGRPLWTFVDHNLRKRRRLGYPGGSNPLVLEVGLVVKTVHVSAIFFALPNTVNVSATFLALLKTVNVLAAFWGTAKNGQRISRS